MFREVQQFRQGWLWAGLIAGALLAIGLFGWAMYQQLVLGKPWGNNPMSDTGLMVMGPLIILLMVGLVWLFVALRLVTEVRDDGVYIHYRPLTRTRIAFEDIASCQARTYRAVREYGGWGIKYGPSGKAYNVSGNRGVQLEFRNGSRLLIGSQKADQLAEAITARMR